MASTEEMEVEPAGGDQQSELQPAKETEASDYVSNPAGDATSEPQDPAVQEPTQTSDETAQSQAPMEQDPQPGGAEQVLSEQAPPVSQEPEAPPPADAPPTATKHTEPAIESDTPAVASSDPAVAASDLAVASSDPAVAASDPAVAASDPAVAASDPAAAASDPAAAASDPAVAASDPAAAASDPAAAASDPAVAASDPAVAVSDPVVAASDPAVAAAESPAGEEPFGAEEELPERPAPEPVQVVPLDRAEMINSVLSGRRTSADICRPPAKLLLPLPREGFMCDQCGERFVLPSSLALHQNRRTMEIAYKCKPCDKTCLFDNKCRFLEHLDLHGMAPESLELESVDVTALSAADLSSPTRVLPALGARLITGPPRMVKMATIERPPRPVDISCPMCNTLCTTDTLRAHMCPTSSEALEAVPPRCPECAQPCPSECALLAHHGLHKPNLFPYPYVCPECSVKVLGTHEEYRRHVVAGCLHLTRDLKICCAVCLIEVGDVKSHMLQTHVQKLYKCRKCPLAFESINGFNSHVKVKHGGEPMLGETPYMPILKCPFCAATFNHPKTLREHLASKKHGDRTLEQVRFVFRCPECGVDYGRKELLSDHLTQKHPDFQIAAMDTQGDLALELSEAQGLPPAAATPPPPPPLQPPAVSPMSPAGKVLKQGVPLAADGTPMPMPKIKLEPGRKPLVVHRCIVCQAEFRRKSAYTEHVRAHIEEGVPLCLLCNAAFDSHELLKNHIAEHAAEIGSDRCGLCYAKLGSRDALQLHLETEHDLRDFTCPYCQLQFSALSDLLRHNFAKHRGAAQGRPARPKAPPEPAPGAPHLPDDDDDDDDDLPLSQMAAKKVGIGRGPLPAVTSLYELDSENSSVVSEEAAEGRRRRGGGGGRGGGLKRPRPPGGDGPPRLSQIVKRSQSPDETAFVDRPAPAPPRSGYRCVCCGLQTDIRADFVAHVSLHRQGSQHQCPECGQCYSTKPSLLKHLLLVHRLREPPPEVAASEQQREHQQWEQLMRDLEPGQCHVCRAQCGDEERLQRHLRMHGRAALLAHQRDQARRQRRTQPPPPADDDDRAETLEAIANFVAGSALVADEDEDGEVIELEMKEGQITTKQFRKGVPMVHDESSDEEVVMEDGDEAAAQGNGAPAAETAATAAPAADPGQGKVKAAAAAEQISANGHPQDSPAAPAPADPVSA